MQIYHIGRFTKFLMKQGNFPLAQNMLPKYDTLVDDWTTKMALEIPI